MYPTSSLFEEVAKKDLTEALPGDIVWRKGHVFLLLDIKRSVGLIDSLTVLESRSVTSIKEYSYDGLLKCIDDYDWVLYRFKYLNDSVNYRPIPFYNNNGDPLTEYLYNEDLCVNRGDESSYREGEDVVIDVFSSEYNQMLVYKDDVLFRILDCDSNKVVLKGLPYGVYSAQLTNGVNSSKPTRFEVIQTSVTLQKTGLSIILNASSFNGSLKYIVYCTSSGSRERIIPVRPNLRGYTTFIIPAPSSSSLFLKAFFEGKYGIVSNVPIKI